MLAARFDVSDVDAVLCREALCQHTIRTLLDARRVAYARGYVAAGDEQGSNGEHYRKIANTRS